MVWYIFLASPKSATFSTKPSAMSTFLAARSRWMHCGVCACVCICGQCKSIAQGIISILIRQLLFQPHMVRAHYTLGLLYFNVAMTVCIRTFFDERCSIPLATCPAILASCRVQRGFWESLRFERR